MPAVPVHAAMLRGETPRSPSGWPRPAGRWSRRPRALLDAAPRAARARASRRTRASRRRAATRPGRGDARPAPRRPGCSTSGSTATRLIDGSLAIGVDIGGTKVAAGVVDESGPGARPRATRHARRTRGTPRRVIVDVVTPAAGSATRSSRSASAPPAGSPTTTPPCCSRRTWPGATSRCATRWPTGSRAAGRRERRQRRRLGRVPLRRRRGTSRSSSASPSARASAAGWSSTARCSAAPTASPASTGT